MACGVSLKRGLVLAAISVVALASASLAHGASASSTAQARQLGTGCEPNGLPSSLAVCEGTGRLSVRLRGTAVLTVQGGRVTLKGKATRVCKRKRVRRNDGKIVMRRVCSKRPKPILPRGVETRRARGYTIYVGELLYFYLPAGNWRVSAKGVGVSLSAVGEGQAGVQAHVAPESTTIEPGLISVGGEIYDEWPRRWTKYLFGPDVEQDEEADSIDTPSSDERRSSTMSIAGVPGRAASDDGADLEQAKKLLTEVTKEIESAAGEAAEHYSSDAQLPNHSG